MKGKIKRGVLYLVLGFLSLFGFRLIYGYVVTPNSATVELAAETSRAENRGRLVKNNFASEKLQVARGADKVSVDQKYEKVGSLASKTDSFDEDEKKARDQVATHHALIQFEQNTGLRGHRRLDLAIGVPPDKFESLVSEMREIGRLATIHIDKADKTNEYKELNAKRVSLEKTRDSLASLKGKTGQIEEFINLENRILEIEEEIQSTGVKLGEYDQENEFCTVRFALEEGRGAPAGVPFIQRVKVAFEWAISIYLRLLGMLAVAAVLAFLSLLLVERTHWARAAAANYMQKA
jgi:hypothetical protein